MDDTSLAAAVVDRLLHHATTINIRGGQSYRLKERRRAGLLPLDDAPLKDDPDPNDRLKRM